MPEFYTTAEAECAKVHPVELNTAEPLGKDPFDIKSWEDPDFVAAAFDEGEVARVTVEMWSDSGGVSSSLYRMYVTTHRMMQDAGIDGTIPMPECYVIKMTRNEKLSKDMALTREALFLTHARHDDRIGALLPAVSYCRCDTTTGKRVIVLPFVRGVQAGQLFGKGSPLNWTVDLEAKLREVRHIPCMNVHNVTLEIVRLAAVLHGRFWNDRVVLIEQPEVLPGIGDDTLRCRSWLRGNDEKAWEVSMDQARKPWLEIRDTPTVRDSWDHELVALLDVAFNTVSWTLVQSEWAELPLTLVHGDFHPANVIVTPVVPVHGSDCIDDTPMVRSVRGSVDLNSAVPKIVLVDWEMVGIGSGPQEIGQFMISHATPELRREMEPNVLREYTVKIQEILRSQYTRGGRLDHDAMSDDPAFIALLREDKATRAQIRHEYIRGGLGKWLWFLPLLAKMMPGPPITYFVGQVTAFMKDHLAELSDSIILPRV